MTIKRKRKTKTQKLKTRFFPFSPGIPWLVDSFSYIIPKIDFETWAQVISNKNIVITVFGGLLESLFSLCVAEAVISFEPNHKIQWIGKEEYFPLLRYQGICKPSPINLTSKILKKYPVPLFLDKANNAYFNILHNYKVKTTYHGRYPYPVKLPVLEQLSRNILIPWNGYLPKLRYLGNEFTENLYKTRIKSTSKVITIILNKTNDDILSWNVQQIKEFAQLAAHKGWKVVVFTKHLTAFGSNVLCFEYNYTNILQMIIKSWVVLSNDIDWLLISMMISNVNIVSKNINGQYNLFENAEAIGVSNDIFTNRTLTTIDAFEICEGI